MTVEGYQTYNAADDLINRNLQTGRSDRIAVIDSAGSHSYGRMAEKINQFANFITQSGIKREDRILLCLNDTLDFPICFLGAIKAGVIPIPVNTRLTEDDYRYILNDSRANMLIVSKDLSEFFFNHLNDHDNLEQTIISKGDIDGYQNLSASLEGQSTSFEAAATSADDMCFWLYTSGTTGKPKGTVHIHSSLLATADLYAVPTLGISDQDVVYSAAKLFFAYGLGNGLTFPFAVGATVILLEGPPAPDDVCRILRENRPTIFYGVPTLFGILLASDQLPQKGEHNMRICTSAGEALPADLLSRWREQTGTDILDGIGSTEMLHIFISNRQEDVRPGSTGKAVPGYDIRLVDDAGYPVEQGEMGALEISGPSAGIMYWNQRAKSLETFHGPWTRSGDKYIQDEDGYYIYSGRTDDMLKVGGIYVSPFEVEGALISHEAVLEAAVVGHPDADELIKPKAFVVLTQSHSASDAMSSELQEHVKSKLAAFKYPRWIEFIDDLPKTATGKIQRYKLRS